MNTATPLRMFLDKMKQKQSEQKQAGKDRPYFVDPMYARYMGNTGTGDNATVEPQMPVAMMATARGPRMLHEGEDMYQKPNGKVDVVPAEKSIMPMKQDQAVRMQAMGRVPGYAIGATNVSGVGLNGAWKAQKPLDTRMNLTPPKEVTKQNFSTAAPKPPLPPPTLPTQTLSLTASKQPEVKPVELNPAMNSEPATLPTQTLSATAQKPPEIKPVELNPAMTAPVEQAAIKPVVASPTGLSYSQQAMGRLNDIMTGGGALRAIQDRQLQDLKSSEGMKERVAGFEAAQGNLTPEAAAAARAMGRAVSGSQIAGAQAEMTGKEMTQQEQAARDLVTGGQTLQGMEQSQQNQVTKLINDGWSKEQINTQLGTNLTDADFSRMKNSGTGVMSQASALIKAGGPANYAAANTIFRNAGLPEIDFSRVEAGELDGPISQLDNTINTMLDAGADPSTISGLYALRTTLQNKQWSAYGIDPATTTLRNPDGSTTTVGEILSSVDNPASATPKTAQTVAKITGGALDFYDNGEGDVYMEQLSSNSAWNTLYDKAKGGDDASATEMGKVMGAIWVMQNAINDPTAPKPNAFQTELLKKYDVLREMPVTQAEVQPKINNISTLFSNGDIKGAEQAYNNLTDAEKKLVGNWDDISQAGIGSLVTSIIDNNKYDSYLINRKPDDPLYKAIFERVPLLSMSYNDNAGGDDTISGAPKVGTWVKYNTPDGIKLLKVTFNGHLDTSGFSNRAYLEFQDSDGNMYSANGKATLGKGIDRKYNRKG